MRQSRWFGITLKEAPREAQTAGHKLLQRAGFLRSAGAGIPVVMPGLLRVLNRLAGALRTELDARGFVEWALPLLQPPAFWEGPAQEPGIFAFKDRRGALLGIGADPAPLTAAVAAREIRSYKDLPKRVFQIAKQVGDEARTRNALINDREFLALDAFSFDADEPAAASSYQSMQEAVEAACQQAELSCRSVADDLDGAGRRHAFVAPAADGDETIVACDACGCAATQAAGQSRLEEFPQDPEPKPLQAVHGPGLIGVDPLAEFLGIPVWQTTKTLLFQADDRLAAVMVRGDCDVNEAKVRRHLKCRELALASPQAILDLTGAEVGYAGGVGLPPGVVVLADHFTRGRVNFECGANRTDYHLINVNWGRDLPLPVFGDFKLAREGDRCSRCDRGRVREIHAIGLGRILRPDAASGAGLHLSCQGRDGKPRPVLMGSGRLNLNRLVAALVEQHHDDAGLRWPPRVAPFDVHLVGLNLEDEGLRSEAESVYRRLRAEKFDVLFDDRDARAGEKFSDSDLIGVPVRLTISKRTFAEGRLEFKRRSDAQSRMVTFDEARAALKSGCGGPCDRC